MKLLERIHAVGMRRHLSPLTIECYQRWVKTFLVYCAQVQPADEPPADEDDPFDIPRPEKVPMLLMRRGRRAQAASVPGPIMRTCLSIRSSPTQEGWRF
jgi:hypothetical protein